MLAVLALAASLPALPPAVRPHLRPQDPLVAPEQAVLAVGPVADRFGAALACDGARCVVGAPGEPATGRLAEAAYVWGRDAAGWSFEAVLLPTEGASQGEPEPTSFGAAVALAGDRLLVGAPLEQGSGAVHVFERGGSGWTRVHVIAPADGAAGDRFGTAVALAGERAWIGALSDEVGAASGAVHVYERGGPGLWTRTATLKPLDARSAQRFGRALDVDGPWLVVGADGDGLGGLDAGAAYVFEAAGRAWVQRARLAAPAPGALQLFGRAVAIAGERVVVGAPRHFAEEPGAAHVFERRGADWVHVALLAGPPGAHLGRAVDLAGERIAVGATGGAGAALLFERDAAAAWRARALLVASDARSGAGLGTAVALAGGEVLVGAPLHVDGRVQVHADPLGTVSCLGDGSAGACPCGNETAGAAGCTHSGGGGMRIAASGSVSLAADGWSLTASDCPPGNVGLFFCGTVGLERGTPRFDGLACVAGAGLRFAPLWQDAGVATGSRFAAQDPHEAFFAPGMATVWQYWSRDVARGPSPCGTAAALSPAVHLVLAP